MKFITGQPRTCQKTCKALRKWKTNGTVGKRDVYIGPGNVKFITGQAVGKSDRHSRAPAWLRRRRRSGNMTTQVVAKRENLILVMRHCMVGRHETESVQRAGGLQLEKESTIM